MPYKYYNQFNLSNELAQSISSIKSQKKCRLYMSIYSSYYTRT